MNSRNKAWYENLETISFRLGQGSPTLGGQVGGQALFFLGGGSGGPIFCDEMRKNRSFALI